MIPKFTPEFFEDSLNLDVYIIGYRNQGESIILIIKSDENISFACIIDCFEYKRINKTMDILDSLKANHLDMVCWTHPDMDHSLGIDKILSKYANNNTTVWIPETLGDRDTYAYNRRVKETFDTINQNLISRDHSSFHAKSASDSKNLTKLWYEYVKERKTYEFEVISVSPCSELIRRNRICQKVLQKNDYSIALYVRFGSLELFFGGDIENNNIDELVNVSPFFFPKTFNLLKIPHHTSIYSDHMLDLLDTSNKTILACSTVFRKNKNKLPDKKLIERYKKYSHKFLCTGETTGKTEECNYGYIQVTYDLLRENYNYLTNGNANIVFENLVDSN
ncbi:hypothetical protein ACSAZL_01200 [Methanosarcina sp. T3]|uniref:hypothetical protein n=1 Tax=Methanosarcina sp. T3 TaxID=3439062 RepID=UPI003F84C99D